MIKVQVFNREEALQQLPQEPTAVISISTPGDDPAEFEVAGNIKSVLYLSFDDVDRDTSEAIVYGGVERKAKPISMEQAMEIARFIAGGLKSGIMNFIVHCDAGISRSPGVRVALEDVFNGNTSVANMYPLHNRLVARRVVEALKRMEEDR